MDGSAKDEGGISKVKLALGAASLFFFVIGVKRSFRTDDGQEIRGDAREAGDAGDAAATPRGRVPTKRVFR